MLFVTICTFTMPGGKKKRSCLLLQNSPTGSHHSSETTGDNIWLSAVIKIFCLQWKWIFIRFSVIPSAAFSVVDGITAKFFSHLLKSNNDEIKLYCISHPQKCQETHFSKMVLIRNTNRLEFLIYGPEMRYSHIATENKNTEKKQT